ncbi:hypothetical protein VPKG_00029 [Vibrio phage pYD21-A]|uniref:hypothetical protein n=1 Tax=Vibrio phage pYD21-A TaxID=754049 RepID=UPI0002C1599C|nr:hypothetical protein VPKG_00029 [Vibrio phage pYD21-A]AGH16066.1 hypothetical protein VPKG_00029 [Vibrio phage pYD21-A]
MPVITVQDVRDIVPDIGATDAAIQLQIDVVLDKVGACLDANYSEPIAKAIAIYTVAYFADKGKDNNGSTTSRKWADGDAESYATKDSGDNSYWGMVMQLDSSQCVTTAFRTNKVFVVTGRTSKRYDEAQ